jgi:hypothetical protein
LEKLRMKNLLQKIVLMLTVSVMCIVTSAQNASINQASPVAPTNPRLYERDQTFDGSSFRKDNHVWVYTREFADKFGMPLSGVVEGIEGAEAAAFRSVDVGYKRCGMGGKAENCMRLMDEVLDIYIDERKKPLPWATNQMADWVGDGASIGFLQIGDKYPNIQSGRGEEAPLDTVPDSIASGMRTVRPFKDPLTKKEVVVWEDTKSVRNGKDGTDGFRGIKAFKRQSLGGYTLVSLYVAGNRYRSDYQTGFRLVTGESHGLQLGLYQITFPTRLAALIESAMAKQKKEDEQYYRSLLPAPLGTGTSAPANTPFIITNHK